MKEVKTHEIDGVTYVEVRRKAKAGERVIVVDEEDLNGNGYSNGSIFIVGKQLRGFPDLVETRDGITLFDSEYRVLEPLEASPDVLDMLANLARRVTSLESQLSDTQRNAEMLAEELMALKYLTQSNEGDIRMIDQRTQVIDAINKYYAEGRR